jgi:hypothetical protein
MVWKRGWGKGFKSYQPEQLAVLIFGGFAGGLGKIRIAEWRNCG